MVKIALARRLNEYTLEEEPKGTTSVYNHPYLQRPVLNTTTRILQSSQHSLASGIKMGTSTQVCGFLNRLNIQWLVQLAFQDVAIAESDRHQRQ